MVSRVYTPPYKPYRGGLSRPPVGQNPQDGQRPDRNNQQARTQEERGNSSLQESHDQLQVGGNAFRNDVSATQPLYASVSQSSPSTAQGIQIDPGKPVSIDSVLSDFRNTLSSIGTDDRTREEVEVYLQAISLQSAKPNPDTRFIQGTLKTAANTMDGYISNALGKPSNVVREWMDAVLMQDIDFHSDPASTPYSGSTTASRVVAAQAPRPQESTKDVEASSSTLPATDTPTETSTVLAGTSTLSRETKNTVKALVEDARTAQKKGQFDKAETLLHQALGQLPSGDSAAWEGKIHKLRGRYAEKNGQWDTALDAYQQAADAFNVAQKPLLRAGVLHSAASLAEDRGNLTQAKSLYQSVYALDRQHGDTRSEIRSLHDMGRVDFRLGQHESALSNLENAEKSSRQMPSALDTIEKSDLYGTLGAVYRASGMEDKAIEAYSSAARHAKSSGNKQLYAQTLQQYSNVLLDAGLNQRALKVMQALKSLTA